MFTHYSIFMLLIALVLIYLSTVKIFRRKYNHSKKIHHKPLFVSLLVYFLVIFFHSMLCLDYKLLDNDEIYFKLYVPPKKAVELLKHTIDSTPKRSPISTDYETIIDSSNMLKLKITHDGWFKDTSRSVKVNFIENSNKPDFHQLILKTDLSSISDEHLIEFRNVLNEFSSKLFEAVN